MCLLAGMFVVHGTSFAQGPGAQATTAAAETPANPNAATMEFESDVVDYGTIEQGSNDF